MGRRPAMAGSVLLLLLLLFAPWATGEKVLQGLPDLKERDGVYTGYLTLKSGDQPFYWYLDAKHGSSDSPVIISLPTGVGQSALVCALRQGGPYMFSADGSLVSNPNTWNKKYPMLYIDPLPSVGFATALPSQPQAEVSSLTEEVLVTAYTAAIVEAANNLSFTDRSVVLVGAYYGGKLAPLIAASLAEKSVSVSHVVIGSAVLDLTVQLPHVGVFANGFGLINEYQLDVVQSHVDDFLACADEEDWLCAWNAYDAHSRTVDDFVQITNEWDIRRMTKYSEVQSIGAYLATVAAGIMLNVADDSDAFTVVNIEIAEQLRGDFVKPVPIAVFEELLENGVHILTYGSQMSLRVPQTAMEYWAQLVAPFRADAVEKSFYWVKYAEAPVAAFKQKGNYLHAMLTLESGLIGQTRPREAKDFLFSFLEWTSGEFTLKRANTRQLRGADPSSRDPGDDIDDKSASASKITEKHTRRLLRSLETDQSHAGYVTVDKKLGAHLFYWYFEARSNVTDAPVILWLNGGPACSSLIGLFQELGPFYVNETTRELETNPHSWNNDYGLLFIDQPVGTGFSYVEDAEGYVTNEGKLADEMDIGLHAIYNDVPQLQGRDFYIFGESYAGKYIPAITTRLLKANEAGEEPTIPLKGIGIGNGWTDPGMQSKRQGDFALNAGLVDLLGYDVIQKLAVELEQNLKNEKYDEAYAQSNAQLDAQRSGAGHGGGHSMVNWYDIRQYGDYDAVAYTDYLNLESTQKALGTDVANITWRECMDDAYDALFHDEMLSAIDDFPAILEKIDVLVYSGCMDSMCPELGTEEWVRRIEWSGQYNFNFANRQVLRDRGITVGYRSREENLQMVVIREAGHEAPMDQPVTLLNMVRSFVEDDWARFDPILLQVEEYRSNDDESAADGPLSEYEEESIPEMWTALTDWSTFDVTKGTIHENGGFELDRKKLIVLVVGGVAILSLFGLLVLLAMRRKAGLGTEKVAAGPYDVLDD
eukprot:TRINITY_DN1020_c1_g3_i1.p1 TRINITY_DN1020_c1_g3~~TRINITY_DN1020_c1_g3_i1.p1  ORF type:complete len:987 (-),score=205.75 TRINITY_DN1020_c1_g3_i1:33-2993(-)